MFDASGPQGGQAASPVGRFYAVANALPHRQRHMGSVHLWPKIFMTHGTGFDD